jgi:Zn-dependent protease
MSFFHPTYIISILIAISVHEWAHAFSANRLGNPTSEQEGRLTLNPVAHIDLIGALMFVIVGFGWAKPVPVNPSYFKHPKRDMAITALAGPLSNLVLAFIAFVSLTLMADEPAGIFSLLEEPTGEPARIILLQILQGSLFVNLALMAFNLLPIAPLDGSNILRAFIPYSMQYRYDDWLRIGPFVLLFVLVFESFLPFPILTAWVEAIMSFILSIFEVIM